MAVKTGQFAKVTMTIPAEPTPVVVEIMKLREWEISVESNKIDTTAAGQTWETHEVGHLKWEGSATCIDADTFYFAHLDAQLEVNFYDHEDDATPAFTGTASFDVDRSSSYDDVIETELSFTGTGALTEGA
jgi:hypothetical protein